LFSISFGTYALKYTQCPAVPKYSVCTNINMNFFFTYLYSHTAKYIGTEKHNNIIITRLNRLRNHSGYLKKYWGTITLLLVHVRYYYHYTCTLKKGIPPPVKTGRHDVVEILLKVASKLNQSINQSINQSMYPKYFLVFVIYFFYINIWYLWVLFVKHTILTYAS
jgi:hypothetical protein